MLLSLWFVTALLCHGVAAEPWNANMATFGHSIKNGPLPAATELTTFEYNCTSSSGAACVVTQIHIPSIYPKGGQPSDWQDGTLRVYVDGETTASIELLLTELAWVGKIARANPMVDNRGLPWGVDRFGHTASSGGVYSTVRIPFQKSIRTTIQAPASATDGGTYWFIIRGVANYPIRVGDVTLPPQARLRMYRVSAVLDRYQLVNLTTVPAGNDGLYFGMQFDGSGGPGVGYTYLEGCVRFYNGEATTPLFLSSGAEDYFLSASYFDAGEFVTNEAGLTYKGGSGDLSAYKLHQDDPVFFANGMRLEWRMCEKTQGCGSTELCPDQFCPPGQGPKHQASAVDHLAVEAAKHAVNHHSAPASTSAVATPGNCSGVGPIAEGFDRPGDDHLCFTMKGSNPTPQDCAAHCCNTTECQAWVYAVTPGPYLDCEKKGDICCWLKTGVTQIVKSDVPKIASGVVAGHPHTPPPPPPPSPSPPAPPAPPVPQGKAQYDTIVWVYQWPSSSVSSGQDFVATRPTVALRVAMQLEAAGAVDNKHADRIVELLLQDVDGSAAPATHRRAVRVREVLGALDGMALDSAGARRAIDRLLNFVVEK